MNSLTKQYGTFTVEFSIVAIALSFLLAFTFDVVSKQSVKGKLDRLSHSAVNVIKERTQLYPEQPNIDESNIETVHGILKQSLTRTMGDFSELKFGAIYEQFIGSTGQVESIPKGLNCTQKKNIEGLKHLSPITSFDRKASLYQVTLCYEVTGWTSIFSDNESTIISLTP